ncbi:helix-turn-helix transcriptional regulator [Streptomyces sp. NPDC005329]|uniref:helix-turn-helix domain-containing protein n=1 Tax=Streptomyces sp. NPDC005329 TaxID=3157034 RepID=UPI0033B42976
MSDEQRKAPGRRAIETGPTGKTVGKKLADLRKVRGLTTRQLSAKLERAGRPIPASGITRMESGERQVTADDLVALAVALNTSPITLLLPSTWGDADVEVTGKGSIKARTAWRWVRGLGPANDWGTDDDAVEVGPDDEYWDQGEREYLEEKEKFDAVTLPPELRRVRQHPAGRDADLVALHVDRLIRMSDRASEDAFGDQLARAKGAVDRLVTELDRLAEERVLRKGQKGGADG